jgi:hypothetical protein
MSRVSISRITDTSSACVCSSNNQSAFAPSFSQLCRVSLHLVLQVDRQSRLGEVVPPFRIRAAWHRSGGVSRIHVPQARQGAGSLPGPAGELTGNFRGPRPPGTRFADGKWPPPLALPGGRARAFCQHTNFSCAGELLQTGRNLICFTTPKNYPGT